MPATSRKWIVAMLQPRCGLICPSSVVQELKRRFAKSVETGDDSYIPPDLTGITYAIVSTRFPRGVVGAY